MNATERLSARLQEHPQAINKVVDFDAERDKLCPLDLTAGNHELDGVILNDVICFSRWVSQKLADNHCCYGIGGYLELRTIYNNRERFAAEGQEGRNLHLGVDIWGNAGTPVYAPLPGKIHSFQDNIHFGDYGPAIILEHDLAGFRLYSLYGHLCRSNLKGLTVGQEISAGQLIANFGTTDENGNWPPHLHFQLMLDMQGYWGDFPGVCKSSEKDKYLEVIADPEVILRMNTYCRGIG